jgi:hypothetical protein
VLLGEDSAVLLGQPVSLKETVVVYAYGRLPRGTVRIKPASHRTMQLSNGWPTACIHCCSFELLLRQCTAVEGPCLSSNHDHGDHESCWLAEQPAQCTYTLKPLGMQPASVV